MHCLVLQIFDWLRKERPEALNKLVPVCGDITLHELGISPADQKILADSVSVVFHSAATVKFDEALKLSVGMNIMGTKRIVQLCHKMVKLEVSSVRFFWGRSLRDYGSRHLHPEFGSFWTQFFVSARNI
jgi:thioester reductase-like protein